MPRKKGRVVGIVNQKGGTGKSTVATNLAAILATAGREVLLIDADTQNSSVQWNTVRPDEVIQVSVVSLPVSNLHKEVEQLRKKYDYLLIDGGGRITETARAAVAVADFAIVPTRPSKPDIQSTEEFFETVVKQVAAIKGKVNGAILINMMKTGTVIGRKSMEHLRGLGYPLLDTILHDYVAYQEALARGLSVVEHDQGHTSAREMQDLYAEVVGVV